MNNKNLFIFYFITFIDQIKKYITSFKIKSKYFVEYFVIVDKMTN